MDALRIILLIIGAGIIFAVYLYSRSQFGATKRATKTKNETTNSRLYNIREKLQHILRKFSLATFNRSQDENRQHSRAQFDELDEESLNTLAGLVANKTDTAAIVSNEAVSANLKPDQEADFDPDVLQAVNVIDATEINQQPGEDYLLVLNIKPKAGGVFTGAQILHASKAAGMQFGMHDIFHRYAIVHDRVQKTPICSMANMFEPGTFNFSDVSSVEVPGLVMFMQLPGPLDAESAFESTLRTAQKIALELDARLCDDSHSILTTQTIEHLKEKMKAYHFRQRMQATRHHS